MNAFFLININYNFTRLKYKFKQIRLLQSHLYADGYISRFGTMDLII